MNENTTSRKEFLINSGMGMMALTPFTTSLDYASDINSSSKEGEMKITKIEIVQFKQGWWTWVKLHTNKGITGIGETYPFAEAQAGALKDLARVIIGRNPLEIEKLWQRLYFRAAYNTTGGAEMRVISAINIAQWDILGKYLNTPVYQLLGGKVRNKIKVYNTTGHGKVKKNWSNEKDIKKIAKFLLSRGIAGIKIWPFDDIAIKNEGNYISLNEIEKNLDWVKRIRNAVGNDMEIAMEFHAHWNLPCAQRIARALEPYNIMWLEDIMQPNNAEGFATLAAETSIPVLVSERLTTSFSYLKFLKAQALNIAMFDTTWCGGITAAKKISDLANVFHVPVTPHTYGGPILWYASMHVAASVKNLYIMESGYNLYTRVYPNYLRHC